MSGTDRREEKRLELLPEKSVNEKALGNRSGGRSQGSPDENCSRHQHGRMLQGHGACGLHCIKMKDITVRDGDTVMVENVNLHIHCGKVTAIIGRNGAGKSTLIKAILGEIPHEGTIEFTDLRNQKAESLRIGYVPQHLNIEKNTPASVYDLFASYISNVPVYLLRPKKLKEKIMRQLEMFQAQELIDRQVCDLSGGELQRVLLSIACTPAPNLLLLDEPVSGIDKNGMQLFYHKIADLKKHYDLAIILVSHDMEFVERYADEVILLDKTVIKAGKPREVLESEEFEKVFGSGKGYGRHAVDIGLFTI